MEFVTIDGIKCFGEVRPGNHYAIVWCEQPATVVDDELGNDASITGWDQVVKAIREQHVGDIVEIHAH